MAAIEASQAKRSIMKAAPTKLLIPRPPRNPRKTGQH
jgi:hypothetical protein